MRHMLKQRAIEQFEIAGAVRAWRWVIFLPAMVGFWTWLAVEAFLMAKSAWPWITAPINAGDHALEQWTIRAGLAATILTGVALPALVTWGAMRAARGSWPIRAAGWLLLLEQLLRLTAIVVPDGWAGVTLIEGSGWFWLGSMSFSAVTLILTRGPQVGGKLCIHVVAVCAALFSRALALNDSIAPETPMTTMELLGWLADEAVSVRWRLHFAALGVALPVMMITRAATIVALNTSKQLFYQGFNMIPDWQHAPGDIAPMPARPAAQAPQPPEEPPSPVAESPQPSEEQPQPPQSPQPPPLP